MATRRRASVVTSLWNRTQQHNVSISTSHTFHSSPSNRDSISLRHPDGSFEDLGRVEGDSSYIETIKRLSSRTACHPSPPPYSSMEDMWNDTPRQAWRSFRKKIGLATSLDAQTMSALVKKLLSLNNSASVPYVVISYPAIAALYKQDINDMAECLGLPKLTGLYRDHPVEIYAAYVGHGLGVCEHIEDGDRYKEEGKRLPVHETLLVEYTDQAVLLYTRSLRTAVDVDRGSDDPHTIASFELCANSRVDEYLSRVREFAHRFLGSWYSKWLIPDTLLVIMTGIADEAIEEAVREAAGRVVPKVRVLSSKSEFVASRGSTELTWRVTGMELS
ncbi:hypothetical protein N7457_004295 [Penicillium paradoxum]|uniref:uncharacterized protein n=1 Tax=Penicillium paradoxum TaxID=176176 RepID=UPI00254747ED|nr:uncharacterized protein N7457_004295 [Penicillium paradoxum]KAJ5782521.1 hypothetical protein N7457_004295 [Penicillium paradoxum]